MEIVINNVWELLLSVLVFGIGWGMGETIAESLFNKDKNKED